MKPAPTVTVAIIEHDSSARTALQHLLTDIGFTDILIADKIDHASLSDPFVSYPLIFVGWQIWDHMKWSIVSTLRKDQTQQGRKILLFVSIDHLINLLEAIHFGIDGYITYPFSLHNIHQKIRMMLPHMPFETYKPPPQGQRKHRAQKSPQSAFAD